jgi:type I restriction enzyme R subunit
MSNVVQIERKTQNRVVALLRDTLGYKYFSSWRERRNNRNIGWDGVRDAS